jgi:hypothetical protein
MFGRMIKAAATAFRSGPVQYVEAHRVDVDDTFRMVPATFAIAPVMVAGWGGMVPHGGLAGIESALFTGRVVALRSIGGTLPGQATSAPLVNQKGV